MKKRKIKVEGFEYEIQGKIIGLVVDTKEDYVLALKPKSNEEVKNDRYKKTR